jgi:uncharacterized protein YndB with AHSA1/START domain
MAWDGRIGTQISERHGLPCMLDLGGPAKGSNASPVGRERLSRADHARFVKWEFEHSVQARTSRERVWTLWTDVSGWPSWNPGVGHAQLDGPVTEGATGTVRAVGGPTSTLRVLAIEPERRFVTETSERFMRLRFEHELADVDGGELRITHRVRMTGPATPLMRRTVGPRLERSIPAALAALVELVMVAPPPENG